MEETVASCAGVKRPRLYDAVSCPLYTQSFTGDWTQKHATDTTRGVIEQCLIGKQKGRVYASVGQLTAS